MTFSKNLKLAIAATAAAALGTGVATAQEDYPSRPIEISVWASAGGATDMTNRFLAEELQKALGGKVNVVNRTGGGGGVAMNHVWSQDHDGYSILGASEGMQVVKALEYHPTGTGDWRWYMASGAPGSLAVSGESQYETLDDLIQAAKDNPGEIKIGHCAIGCVWHMKALALGQAAGVEFNYVPFEGSAPAQVAALTGEVDAVVSGISEQAEFIKADKYRPLAMIEMEPYDFPGKGEIPAAGATYPDIQAIPARQWLGMAVPKDVPAEVTAKLDAAFEKAMQSDKMKSMETDRQLPLIGIYGDEAAEQLQKMENTMSYKLYELGVAETDPETLGIEKPQQ